MICERCFKNKAEYEIRWFVVNDRDGKLDKFEANICGNCLSDTDTDFRKRNQPYEIYFIPTGEKVG